MSLRTSLRKALSPDYRHSCANIDVLVATIRQTHSRVIWAEDTGNRWVVCNESGKIYWFESDGLDTSRWRLCTIDDSVHPMSSWMQFRVTSDADMGRVAAAIVEAIDGLRPWLVERIRQSQLRLAQDRS